MPQASNGNGSQLSLSLSLLSRSRFGNFFNGGGGKSDDAIFRDFLFSAKRWRKIVGKIFGASGMEIIDGRNRRSNTAIEYVRIIASCREMVEQIAELCRINFLMVPLEDTFAND